MTGPPAVAAQEVPVDRARPASAGAPAALKRPDAAGDRRGASQHARAFSRAVQGLAEVGNDKSLAVWSVNFPIAKGR
ncbi:MAG: hypothetical protein ACK6AD_01985 [Cyanobacteriota bacterium]